MNGFNAKAVPCYFLICLGYAHNLETGPPSESLSLSEEDLEHIPQPEIRKTTQLVVTI